MSDDYYDEVRYLEELERLEAARPQHDERTCEVCDKPISSGYWCRRCDNDGRMI